MAVKLSKLTAIAAALALLAAPAAAQAPEPQARELAQRLTQTEFDLVGEGYARAAGPFAGALGEGEARGVTVTLRAQQSYRIAAVCESRCGQAHVRVLDPSGRRIGVDNPHVGAWLVDVRPQTTGQYSIEVTMQRCAAAQCWYAFNIYAR